MNIKGHRDRFTLESGKTRMNVVPHLKGLVSDIMVDIQNGMSISLKMLAPRKNIIGMVVGMLGRVMNTADSPQGMFRFPIEGISSEILMNTGTHRDGTKLDSRKTTIIDNLADLRGKMSSPLADVQSLIQQLKSYTHGRRRTLDGQGSEVLG